jgi:hypothetical protein
MSTGGGDFGLRILDRSGASAARNPEALEAFLQLEPGEVKELGSLPEVDPLIEIVPEHLGFEEISGSVGATAGGAMGESLEEPVVESVQEDDSLLSSARDDGELSLLDPVQDLPGPLG